MHAFALRALVALCTWAGLSLTLGCTTPTGNQATPEQGRVTGAVSAAPVVMVTDAALLPPFEEGNAAV